MMGFENFSREAYKLAFGEDQAYKDNLVSRRDMSSCLLVTFVPFSPLVCYCPDYFWDRILEVGRNVLG